MTLAYKISQYNRQRKWKIFLDKINPGEKDKILDVGFSDKEYSSVDNFLEKNYIYPENITAISIDKGEEFKERYPKVKTISYDGQKMPFLNKDFDLTWSNAVIEHVGGRNAQINFLRELKRVSKKSFITTPNKFFPIEVHTRIPFLHWLPKKLFDYFLKKINKDWAAGEYMNLLSLSKLKKILAEAEISDYKIIKNKLLFFTLDFIIIF